jgi:hypothetical protein
MFICGLDVASSPTGDYSVFTVVEKTAGEGKSHFAIRYIHRWPLGTEYPQLVHDVVRMLDRPPLPGCTVVVDSTGVGLAFFQSLRQALDERTRQAKAPAVLVPMVITGGIYAAPAKGGWSVPKRDLVSILVALLGEQRLTIADVPEKALLIKELRTFTRKISTLTAHDSYEVISSRDHDDIICSASLACWYGERCCRPAGTVRAYRTGLSSSSFLKIAVLSKDQLADEECLDHGCILISCNNPGESTLPAHKLNLIEGVALQFLDNAPEDFTSAWTEPVPGYSYLPSDLLLNQMEGKKLWACLKRKREPSVYVEVIVVADDGGSDRRALSLAYAIADAQRFRRSRTILRMAAPDWKPSEDDAELKDTALINPHAYTVAKQSSAMVIGGGIPLKPQPRPKMLSFAGHPIPGFIRGVHG